MKTKILSILALLLMTVTQGAWAQEETLLITIENTGDNASFKSGSRTFGDIATITFSGEVCNDNDYWGWYYFHEECTLTVTAAEGYTITRVKFSTASNSAFDEEAPFEAILVDYNDDHIAKVNGTSIDCYGVNMIEVYGYAAAPAGPATSGIDWNASTNSGTFSMPAYDVEVSTELWYILKQNGETPAGNKAKTDVFLDRTLQSLPGDNKGWNTFCAPFDISAEKVSALGMTVKAFTGSTLSGGTLTLHFETASSIAAGTPYLVQVASNLNFAADGNEFAGVTQDWTAHNATSTYADFLPVLEPTVLNEGDKTVLFVYGGNELGHPSVTGNILGFRAYFQLKDAAASVKAFAMSFDDEVATGIGSLTPNPSPVGEGSIYSLDGRKYEKKPTQKGVYIVNGKKTIIKQEM